MVFLDLDIALSADILEADSFNPRCFGESTIGTWSSLNQSSGFSVLMAIASVLDPLMIDLSLAHSVEIRFN